MEHFSRRAMSLCESIVGLCFFIVSPADAQVRDIEFTQLSGAAPGFATYQSNNQIIVANRQGVFAVYIDTDTAPDQGPRVNHWTLVRSIDGGRSFTPLYRAQGYANVPSVETDEDDNIYLFVYDLVPASNDGSGQVVFYKFLASDNYVSPTTVTIPNGQFVDKFVAIYDRTRGRFYFFSGLERNFLVIDKSGNIQRSEQLFKNGPQTILEYPHIAMDGPRLFLAWTTTTRARPWRYHSIHFVFSDDGAATWMTPTTTQPLRLPVVSDDTGPLPQLVPGHYLGTSAWLSNITAIDGWLHLMYMAGGRELYQRVSVSSGAIFTLDGTWEADGLRFLSLDGFFAKSWGDKRVLYAIAADYADQDAEGNASIVVLKSDDNSETWRAHAKSSQRFRPYALGGARIVARRGEIIGLFTNLVGTMERPDSNQVYFFKVRE